MTTLPARLRRTAYQYTSIRHEAAQEIERLTAERDRLREALEKITAECEWPGLRAQTYRAIARAALKETSK